MAQVTVPGVGGGRVEVAARQAAKLTADATGERRPAPFTEEQVQLRATVRDEHGTVSSISCAADAISPSWIGLICA